MAGRFDSVESHLLVGILGLNTAVFALMGAVLVEGFDRWCYAIWALWAFGFALRRLFRAIRIKLTGYPNHRPK